MSFPCCSASVLVRSQALVEELLDLQIIVREKIEWNVGSQRLVDFDLVPHLVLKFVQYLADSHWTRDLFGMSHGSKRN